jgi:hypothetical protein
VAEGFVDGSRTDFINLSLYEVTLVLDDKLVNEREADSQLPLLLHLHSRHT